MISRVGCTGNEFHINHHGNLTASLTSDRNISGSARQIMHVIATCRSFLNHHCARQRPRSCTLAKTLPRSFAMTPVRGDFMVSLTGHISARHGLLVLRQNSSDRFDIIGQAFKLKDYRPCGAARTGILQRVCDCARGLKHDLLVPDV